VDRRVEHDPTAAPQRRWIKVKAEPGRSDGAGLMRDPEVDPRAMVFVVGMPESGIEAITDELVHLGLRPVPTHGVAGDHEDVSVSLDRFLDELFAELGATIDVPVLLPRLELLRRLEHREGEARQLFEAACRASKSDGDDERKGTGSATDGDRTVWVWGDPRNTLLAPFWIEALGLAAEVVLVHRAPAEVARSMASKNDRSVDGNLDLWDQFNRAALSLWEGQPGLIVGIEAFGDDVGRGVEGLRGFVERLGVTPTPEQLARAADSFSGVARPPADEPDLEVGNHLLVLDRALRQAFLDLSVEPEAMAREFVGYYDQEYYEHYGDNDVDPYRPGAPQWTNFFSMVADRITSDLRPSSTLDAGCAIGFLVEALRDRGVDAYGIDVSEWAISQVPPSVRPFCTVASLTDEIEGHFDLVTIIEVIEHMPDSVAGFVIGNLTRHAEAVLFSSTSDGFEESTHINVHTPDHWAALFAANGFTRDFDYDASYLTQDAILFRRGSLDPHDLVVGYEQQLWWLRQTTTQQLKDLTVDRDHQRELLRIESERHEALAQQLESSRPEVDEHTSALRALEAERRAERLEAEARVLHGDLEISALQGELARAEQVNEQLGLRVAYLESTPSARLAGTVRRIFGMFRGPAGP